MVLGGKCGLAETNKISCYIYDELGNFIKEFKSYRDASIELSRNFKTVWSAIKNKYKCAGYFITDTKYDKLDLSKMHPYEGHKKFQCSNMMKWEDMNVVMTQLMMQHEY